VAIGRNALAFHQDNPDKLPVTTVLETSGPNPLIDQLLGVRVAGLRDSSVYLDLGPGVQGSDREQALGLLRSYPLILFGAARCCTWLGTIGVLPTVAADPLLMAFALDPNQPLDLQALSAKYLDRPLQTLSGESLDAGIIQRLSGMLLQEPIPPVAIAIRDLHEKLRSSPNWTGEADLEPILDQELALVPVIAKMEMTGIAVDKAALEGLSKELAQTAHELEVKLEALLPKS
jgi:DNA polymerase-1